MKLYKQGITDTDKCPSCDSVDYVEHFLYECKCVKTLWAHIEKLYLINYGTSLSLDLHHVIVGYKLDNFVTFQYINMLILIGKLTISKYKYGKYVGTITSLFEQECVLRGIS